MEDVNVVRCGNRQIENADAFCEIQLDSTKLSDIAKPLIIRARQTALKITDMLYSAPAFIDVIRASVPKEFLTAVLTDEQKGKIASGALQLMTKKDGSLLATLIDPVTKRTISNIPLQNVKVSPEIGHAISSYSTQVQMAQIAEKIELVQRAVEDIRIGQENDRLATAFSCEQKFLQAREIKSLKLKNIALLRIAMDAEDSRNLLMQSQKMNVNFIKEQPESLWEKMLKGANPKEISFRICEIREGLYAINAVSLVQAMSYQEIGETESARQSLKFYGQHLKSVFLDMAGFIERLDQIDDSPENYWSQTVPEIEQKIVALPNMSIFEELEG